MPRRDNARAVGTERAWAGAAAATARRPRGLFLFWRLGGFLGFSGRAELFSFLLDLSQRFLFDAPLLVLDLAEFRLFALAGFLDLALALLDVLAFSRLNQRTGACIHLSSGEFAQHLLLPLVAALVWRRLLENARLRLRLRRLRFLLLRFFCQTWHRDALALRLNKNGFGAAMAEVLADVALLHSPLYIQRHRSSGRLPFSCPFLSFRSFFTLAQGIFCSIPCAIAAKTIESLDECAGCPAIFNSRMYYIRAPHRQANFGRCETVFRVRCGLFPSRGPQTFCLASPCRLQRHRWHEVDKRSLYGSAPPQPL